MDKIGWRAAWGLCLLQLSLAQIDLNVTCRYSGVFHVEKNGRYSISRTEAADLCAAFNCTLPTMAQMEEARRAGFETCRYGFIEGHVVIPRIHPNSICAANHTGVYILPSNTSQYDTYCFNASAPQGEDCTSITDLPNAFEGPITITIVNRDGTRYTKRGEYRTNPDDINATTTYEDSSGSPSERYTPTGYSIFHTQLPTEYPTQGGDHPSAPSYPEDTSVTTQLLMQVTTTGTDSNTISAGWEPVEENEDERDKNPSHSGSGIDDDEDFISSTTATTPRVSHIPTQTQDGNKWSPGLFTPEVLLQTTPRMTDVDRNGTTDDGEKWTQEPQPPLIHREQHDEEETQRSTSTRDQDSSSDSAGKHHTTHGSEVDGHSSGSQEGGANTTSGPIRKPQIPEWLIILASLLALALILAVCIAVNSRRRCGQKKKLVINNGNGAVEDRKPSGLNGEASKSQEMVHLVNKEPAETTDQCMTTDETQNLQNEDVKIGA
ncbi:CD44 antigen isoform X9 [Sturnira hondurensis]|uniref:CD44 antigen isoform X9 n=1 Tax=Sturnira hondurensis TaxID=192404 RepID=UPI00187B0F23|nr:CD44 antigen isoform X9 [Sturnira hondurensis]